MNLTVPKSNQKAAKNPSVWDLKFDPGPDPGLDDLMDAVVDLSKEGQLARSPGKENRPCPNTGEPLRSCTCYSCRGRRNRGKGKRTQRTARKGLEKAFGVPAGPSQAATANEETWRLPVRAEVKAGGMAKTVDTFYRNTKNQADKDKAIGDVRSFMAVAMVDGSTDGLCVIRMSDLIQLFAEARR